MIGRKERKEGKKGRKERKGGRKGGKVEGRKVSDKC